MIGGFSCEFRFCGDVVMFLGGPWLTCPYARSCFSAAQLSCLMLCFFLAVPRFPYERVHAFLLHK
jgi:hypothetical protein